MIMFGVGAIWLAVFCISQLIRCLQKTESMLKGCHENYLELHNRMSTKGNCELILVTNAGGHGPEPGYLVIAKARVLSASSTCNIFDISTEGYVSPL